ncbi:MAG: phosphoribosylaminoimidazolesuccinocarboxamide synthase [Gammaproteobacteria bacterium]|nr:phosphoribosylaminoimidazolesuccinocarboxamide synthase [Gammaproteobacteria bacterium]
MPKPVFETKFTSLPLLHKGKVRDIYEVDANHMLVIATDRISAFDVIMPGPIPNKGALLTEVSNFWFQRFSDLIPNQVSSMTLKDLNLTDSEIEQSEGRSVIVKRLKALPIEAIVRGYLIGSGWKEYQSKQSVCGISLPANIPLAGKLPETLFTPSTKAEAGEHDENISFEETITLVGEDIANQVRNVSILLYENAANYALSKGIVIADTKFEFGLDSKGKLTLIDEVLTPDSSRFWPADDYTPGQNPSSFDKQYIRDYLETLDWDKKAPGPELPEEIIKNTQAKYQEAADKLLSK